jgi:hypothetical protein
LLRNATHRRATRREPLQSTAPHFPYAFAALANKHAAERVRNGDFLGQMDSSTPSAFSRIYAPEFVGLLGNMKLSNTPAPNALTFDLSCYMLNG